MTEQYPDQVYHVCSFDQLRRYTAAGWQLVEIGPGWCLVSCGRTEHSEKERLRSELDSASKELDGYSDEIADLKNEIEVLRAEEAILKKENRQLLEKGDQIIEANRKLEQALARVRCHFGDKAFNEAVG